jgi:hypothetical protein
MSRVSEKFFEKRFEPNDSGRLRNLTHLGLACLAPSVYSERAGGKQYETKETEE